MICELNYWEEYSLMIVWNNSQSISVKYENNDYEINSMEQMSMIFLRLSEHKNTRKGGIITGKIKPVEMVETPDIIKERQISSHLLVSVKSSAEKSSSKLFGVSKKSIISITR